MNSSSSSSTKMLRGASACATSVWDELHAPGRVLEMENCRREAESSVHRDRTASFVSSLRREVYSRYEVLRAQFLRKQRELLKTGS